MTTLTICLSLIIIVGIICYTCYKCSGVKEFIDSIDSIKYKVDNLYQEWSFVDDVLLRVNIQLGKLEEKKGE